MDDALRELERRWRASAAPEDEAAWLRARVRAGKLDPWRLELAAACGHPALGGDESPPLAFERWLERLPFAGRRGRLRQEWVRVLLALARALEPLAARLGSGEWVSPALRLAERSALRLGDEPEVLAAARERLGLLAHELHPYTWETMSPAAAIVRLAAAPLEFLLAQREGDARREVATVADQARHALEPEGVWRVEPGLDEAVEALFPRAEGRLWGLRRAIARELVAWALGREDPLRVRPPGAGDG